MNQDRENNRPERKEFSQKQGEKRPYHRDGERRPFNRDGEKRPFNREGEKRGEGRSFNRDGEKRPFNRDGEKRGEGRPFNRDGENRGERRSFNRDGERPFNRNHENRGEGRPFNRDGGNRSFHRDDRKPRADKKPERTISARDAALKALADVVGSGAYAAQALDRALTDAKLSPEDRRLAASLFYFAIENRLRIEWTLGKLMQNRPEPAISDILHIAAAQILFMDKIPDHAAVDEAVKQVRAAKREGLTGLVNGVLRSLIRMRDEGELTLPDPESEPVEYLSVRYSLAKPAVERLIAAYGWDEAEKIAAYSPEERTLTVRPNLTKTDSAAFEALLDREQLSWKKGEVENAYVLTGAGDLSNHAGYKDGTFSIQGESSMLAALAVGAKPGMQLLDACAAPGGKTCLMAEKMGTSGRVYAWDVHPHRVELIRAAAKRLGLENVRPAVHDARKGMESLELAMDAVLVDAPCSGLGVVSDKPDIKYRLKDEDFDSIQPVQKQILENCAKFVRVGGLLVYSTCTILPAENEEQVSDFLSRHPEFEPVTDESWLPESLRGKAVEGMLTILPSRDGMEGFFIARMRRRSV